MAKPKREPVSSVAHRGDPWNWYYLLDQDHNIVRTRNVRKWGDFFNDFAKWRVAVDTVGKADVSTVFLGIDHNWSQVGRPLLFETMIFGSARYADCQWRYTTWDDAKAGHDRIVAAIKDRENLDDLELS